MDCVFVSLLIRAAFSSRSLPCSRFTRGTAADDWRPLSRRYRRVSESGRLAALWHESHLEWDYVGRLLFVLWCTSFISVYGRAVPRCWDKEDSADSVVFWLSAGLRRLHFLDPDFPPFLPGAAWLCVSAVGPGVSGGCKLCPQEGDRLLRAGGPPLYCCSGAPHAFLLPPGLWFSGPSLRVLPSL